jgi:hypothetical protein
MGVSGGISGAGIEVGSPSIQRTALTAGFDPAVLTGTAGVRPTIDTRRLFQRLAARYDGGSEAEDDTEVARRARHR